MFSLKKQLIILLIGLALYLAVASRNFIFLRSLVITTLAAILAESIVLYLKDKKISFSESSVISGLIIGFVLAADCAWWVLTLASVLAISSKHLIRINKRHLFNPAGLGIILVMLGLGANSEWSGTYLWYILMPAGLYLAYRIHKLSLLAGYALATFILFEAQAQAQGSSLFNILGVFSYFFIFIMLIEPKTTPLKTKGQIVFGAAVAAGIFIFSNLGVRFDAELASLLLLNLFVPFLNKLPEKLLKNQKSVRSLTGYKR
jgi:Na+-translocating ferredoxin:NAD+ oxidoreductase RnfD subunit